MIKKSFFLNISFCFLFGEVWPMEPVAPAQLMLSGESSAVSKQSLQADLQAITDYLRDKPSQMEKMLLLLMNRLL